MAEITGKLHSIEPAKTHTEKFTNQEFVVLTDGEFPQHIKLEFQNKNVELLTGFKVDDRVTVSYGIQGRIVEKDGKKSVYNTLRAWKIVQSK